MFFILRIAVLDVKMVLYKKVIVPTVTSGLESCDMEVDEKHNLDDKKMKYSQSMSGVSKIVRWRIEEVRCRLE